MKKIFLLITLFSAGIAHGMGYFHNNTDPGKHPNNLRILAEKYSVYSDENIVIENLPAVNADINKYNLDPETIKNGIFSLTHQTKQFPNKNKILAVDALPIFTAFQLSVEQVVKKVTAEMAAKQKEEIEALTKENIIQKNKNNETEKTKLTTKKQLNSWTAQYPKLSLYGLPVLGFTAATLAIKYSSTIRSLFGIHN